LIRGIPVNHSNGMIPEPIPEWLAKIFTELNKISKKNVNHVLLNEYIEGQGIAAHKDGPLYNGFVSILNLGGSAFMDFFIPETPTIYQVILKPRSLIIFEEDAYYEFFHRIQDKQFDIVNENVINCELAGHKPGDVIQRSPKRLSLTVRAVEVVSNTGIILTDEQKAEMQRRKSFFYRSVSEKG